MNKSPNLPAAATAPAALRDQRLSLAETLDALLADGLVTAERAAELRARSAADRRHPLVVIAECDWENAAQPGQKLTLDVLVHWLADHAGLPYHRIDPLSLDVARVTQLIPYAYAARARILPIKVTPTEIVVATAEPWLRDWERDLAPALKRNITRVLASPTDLDRFIVEFYALARSVKASSEQRGRQPASAQSNIQNLEQLTELGKTGKLTADDQHVVGIVDWLLQYAFEQRASDIHLEPRRERGNIRFRIDGVLHEVYQVPASVMPAVTSRIKILARMDLAEKRKPQDGRIKTRSPGGKEIELRVSSLPTAFGEKLVMRIFDPEVLLKDFNELGLTASGVGDLARHDRRRQRHHPGHRPDRLGQDHDLVFDLAPSRHAGRECLHHRGPDRAGRAGVQSDAGAGQHRSDVCQRRARAAAARIRTSSWSARFATWKPRKTRSRRR
jgi:general secretion pathway protein E